MIGAQVLELIQRTKSTPPGAKRWHPELPSPPLSQSPPSCELAGVESASSQQDGRNASPSPSRHTRRRSLPKLPSKLSNDPVKDLVRVLARIDFDSSPAADVRLKRDSPLSSESSGPLGHSKTSTQALPSPNSDDEVTSQLDPESSIIMLSSACSSVEVEEAGSGSLPTTFLEQSPGIEAISITGAPQQPCKYSMQAPRVPPDAVHDLTGPIHLRNYLDNHMPLPFVPQHLDHHRPPFIPSPTYPADHHIEAHTHHNHTHLNPYSRGAHLQHAAAMNYSYASNPHMPFDHPNFAQPQPYLQYPISSAHYRYDSVSNGHHPQTGVHIAPSTVSSQGSSPETSRSSGSTIALYPPPPQFGPVPLPPHDTYPYGLGMSQPPYHGGVPAFSAPMPISTSTMAGAPVISPVPAMPLVGSLRPALEGGQVLYGRSGKVKFWNVDQGWGYLVDDRAIEIGSGDVFVHFTAIRQDGGGFRFLVTDESVTYDLQLTQKGSRHDRGLSAQNVRDINENAFWHIDREALFEALGLSAFTSAQSQNENGQGSRARPTRPPRRRVIPPQ